MSQSFRPKVPVLRKIRLRALGAFVGSLLALFLLAGCGDTFRPVVRPIPQPGPDPEARALAVIVSEGGGGAGNTTSINVSGDSNVGNVEVGIGAVHAAISAGNLRTLVANRDSNTVTSYGTFAINTSTPVTITLPDGGQPVFVESRGVNFSYVALSGLDSVAAIDNTRSVVAAEIPVGTDPVAMVHVTALNRLYVANQGSDSVTVIDTLENVAAGTIAVGSAPSSIVANADGSRVFVVNQGSGTVSVIDTATDSVMATLAAGSAPNLAVFDSRLQRVYVTSPADNSLVIINANVDPPVLLATVSVAAAPCGGATPVSVTALADGSRAYVANRDSNTVCVLDTNSNTFSATIPVGDSPVSIASDRNSTKVYTANRDSDSITVISTTGNQVVVTLPSGAPQPVFVTVTR